MDFTRIILDGLAASLIFNLTVAVSFFIMPHAFTHMLPKEIKEAARPYTAKELRDLAIVVYAIFIIAVAWMIVSAHNAGIQGFRNLFLTAYTEMMIINFGDFLILDCWLMAVIRKGHRVPGTENCKAWGTKEYMLKMAVPEHFLVWPLVICTVMALVCAGIGVLLA